MSTVCVTNNPLLHYFCVETLTVYSCKQMAAPPPQALLLKLAQGTIRLNLHGDVAPATVDHVVALARSGVLASAGRFYRSDFVIQCGLHGSGVAAPFPPLAVNESTRAGAKSNLRGSVAIAHWDEPDNGNTEFFISLKDNTHLDSAYGGYCVFGSVAAADAASWATCDAVAAAVLRKETPRILAVDLA